jgi:hypothetical protein
LPWALQWIWFHPYERRKGHLRNAWPYFLDRFGTFQVEPPLSPAMDKLLVEEGGDPFETTAPPARHLGRDLGGLIRGKRCRGMWEFDPLGSLRNS